MDMQRIEDISSHKSSYTNAQERISPLHTQFAHSRQECDTCSVTKLCTSHFISRQMLQVSQ